MKEIKILIFKLGNENYATDIMEVERILGYDEPTKLPEVPQFLEGVIKYENSTLPIINLNNRFRLESKSDEDKKIIVVKREGQKYGILVDNVTEVGNINENEIHSPEDVTTLISKQYIKGLVRKKEEIIILLNLNKILTEEEENNILQVN